MEKEKSAAVLTIIDAPSMTWRGRRNIALWLRRQADQLEHEGKNYAKGRYRARYLFV